jgi:hypothetical protein
MITIIQGEDKNIVVKIQQEDGDAYDLSSVTEMEACLLNADGTTLTKTQTGGAITIVDSAPQNGKINVRLEETETALLKKGEDLNMELVIDESGEKKILQFLAEITVLARVC